MVSRRRFTGMIAVLVCAAVAMASAGPVSAQEKVTVFAAASLKTALDTINAAWKADGGKEVTISYAASSALARQIEAGAPADLFISADLDWMAYLSERKLVKASTETRLLGNRIVLVAPADSTAATMIAPGFDLAALLGDGRLAMANVDAVPAGRYGKAALEKLGVWTSVQAKVAQAENVRAALALVATGEAPLGIVYQTDATADPKVRVVAAFPQDTHPPIIYPAAETADATAADTGAFLSYLRSAKARALFEQQGFALLVPVASN